MHCPEACRVGITVKNGVSSLDLNVHLQKHTCFITSAAITLGNSQNFRGARTIANFRVQNPNPKTDNCACDLPPNVEGDVFLPQGSTSTGI
jgi:hypothetical protein